MTTTITPQSAGSGFSQSFKRETRKWRRTSRWYKQAVLWTILFGILAFLFYTLLAPVSWLINMMNEVYAFVSDPSAMALVRTLSRQGNVVPSVQFSSASLVLPLIFAAAYTIIAQALIVVFNSQFFEELNRGTLKWSFSRAITRGAYSISKALADNLGTLIMTVLIPFGVIFIITLAAAKENTITPLNYLATAVLMMLGFVFWHALVMALIFVTRRRALSFGIPVLLLLLGGPLSRMLDGALNTTLISQLSPWTSRNLFTSMLNGTLDFGDSAVIIPILATAAWAILLYLIAWLALRKADI
ncbi:MAG: hypothetical protein IAE89_13400 [Anaerolineae bacterium]|nr:hypothetical protein [Anaerolineae bacterium]